MAVALLVWVWPPVQPPTDATLTLDKLWAAIWPPVLGILLAVMIWYAFWRGGEKPAGVPSHDPLSRFEAVLWRTGASVAAFMTSAEQRLRDWPMAGVLFLLLLALFFAMISL
ncbi:MAG: hypothetical protein ACR2PF_21690 [Rhizobiaceae bacterium]